MLMQRVITAVLLLPVVVAIVFALSLDHFALALAAILSLAAWEWAALAGWRTPAARIGFAALQALVLAGVYVLAPLFENWPAPGLAAGQLGVVDLPLGLIGSAAVFWLLSPVALWFYPQRAGWWRGSALARAALGLLLLTGLWCALISLRRIGQFHDPLKGALIIFYMLLLVWAADIGAYAAGRSFGRRKLAPAVSPGKTWEGLFGGLICAMLVATFTAAPLGLQVSNPVGLYALALATVLASVVGDLVESLAKREAGVKDSSALLPGHGGLLDRIDSLIAAAPVFMLGVLLLDLR